ncbi:hypothetical protein MOUN0_I01266 [Monosporozyma unispora]
MYVSMYNSPFPKLNPKVRYKTALERAGFEVKHPQQEQKVLKQSKSTPNLKTKLQKTFNETLPMLNGSVPNIVAKRQSLTSNSSESRKNSLFNFETNHNSSVMDNEDDEDRFNDTRITSHLESSEEDESIRGNHKNLLQVESHQKSDVVSIDLNSEFVDVSSALLLDNHNNSSEEVLTPILLKNNELPLLHDEHMESNSLSNNTKNVEQLSIQEDIIIRETTSLSIIEDSTHPEMKSQEIESLTSPLKLEELELEEEAEDKVEQESGIEQANIITTSHDAELRKLIDQLDDVVLPKEEALSNNTPTHDLSLNLNLPNNMPKKSSFYLSGISITSTDKEILKGKDEVEKVEPIKRETGTGPCRSCGFAITNHARFANELSGQWHKDCFRCITCNNKFNKTNPCYILDDQPYCQLDYHMANHTMCQICDSFIEGECLENDKQERFHVHCLTCFLCQKVIKNDYFIFNGNIPICGEHDMDQLIKDGIIEFAETSTEAQEPNVMEKRRTRLLNL